MHSERSHFLGALRIGWDDDNLHQIYADWLDENGVGALDTAQAKFQREWTKEWQEADDWLRELAEQGFCNMTKMEEAVKHFLATGQALTVGRDALGFSMTEQFGFREGVTSERFWEMWERWTKTKVPDEVRSQEPFSCCGEDYGWDGP